MESDLTLKFEIFCTIHFACRLSS